MQYLNEKMACEQRIIDAFYEYQSRGGKDNLRKFKRMCEDGMVDLLKYKPSTREQTERRKALFKEAKIAGYIGSYESWAKEMFWK